MNLLTKINTDTLQDLAEVGIDSFLNESLLKDIPIIGTITGLYSSANNISNHLFLRKLADFIAGAKLSEKDRKSILSKLPSEKERNKLGERILLVLNAVTEREKAKLMGIAFKAFAGNKIDAVTLNRIFHVLESSLITDLIYFITTGQNVKAVEDITVLPLASLGLYAPSDSMWGLGNDYHKTEFGHLVSFVLFDVPLPSQTE